MSEWISVKEKLPEFDWKSNPIKMFIPVMAALINGSVQPMYYKANGWSKDDSAPSWGYFDGRGCLSHLVTHWMPFPPAPQD